MSKKNNRQKDKKYIAMLITRADLREKRIADLKLRKVNNRVRYEEKVLNEQRKLRTRKPKVAPVIGSKVKLEKMLKKSMKGLSLGSAKAVKAKKLNMDDSSSGESDDDEADEQMDTDVN